MSTAGAGAGAGAGAALISSNDSAALEEIRTYFTELLTKPARTRAVLKLDVRLINGKIYKTKFKVSKLGPKLRGATYITNRCIEIEIPYDHYKSPTGKKTHSSIHSIIERNTEKNRCFTPMLQSNARNAPPPTRTTTTDVLQVLKLKLLLTHPSVNPKNIWMIDEATIDKVRMTPFRLLRGQAPFYSKYGYLIENGSDIINTLKHITCETLLAEIDKSPKRVGSSFPTIDLSMDLDSLYDLTRKDVYKLALIKQNLETLMHEKSFVAGTLLTDVMTQVSFKDETTRYPFFSQSVYEFLFTDKPIKYIFNPDSAEWSAIAPRILIENVKWAIKKAPIPTNIENGYYANKSDFNVNRRTRKRKSANEGKINNESNFNVNRGTRKRKSTNINRLGWPATSRRRVVPGVAPRIIPPRLRQISSYATQMENGYRANNEFTKKPSSNTTRRRSVVSSIAIGAGAGAGAGAAAKSSTVPTETLETLETLATLKDAKPLIKIYRKITQFIEHGYSRGQLHITLHTIGGKTYDTAFNVKYMLSDDDNNIGNQGSRIQLFIENGCIDMILEGNTNADITSFIRANTGTTHTSCFTPRLQSNSRSEDPARRITTTDVLQILKLKLLLANPNINPNKIFMDDGAKIDGIFMTPYRILRGMKPFYHKYGYISDPDIITPIEEDLKTRTGKMVYDALNKDIGESNQAATKHKLALLRSYIGKLVNSISLPIIAKTGITDKAHIQQLKLLILGHKLTTLLNYVTLEDEKATYPNFSSRLFAYLYPAHHKPPIRFKFNPDSEEWKTQANRVLITHAYLLPNLIQIDKDGDEYTLNTDNIQKFIKL